MVESKYLISKHIEWTFTLTHINYWLGKTHFSETSVCIHYTEHLFYCQSLFLHFFCPLSIYLKRYGIPSRYGYITNPLSQVITECLERYFFILTCVDFFEKTRNSPRIISTCILNQFESIHFLCFCDIYNYMSTARNAIVFILIQSIFHFYKLKVYKILI